MKYFKTTIYLFIFAAAALEIFVFSDVALAADYYKSGAMVSTNLLSGLTNVAAITGFNVSASIPASTTATVQFSRNKLVWYDRLGNAHASTTLADGSNNLDISGLGWSGPLFYYKLNFFTSSSTQTASVTEVTVNYNQSSEPSYIYYKQGAMVSKNLLDGKTDVGDLTQFNITASIPSGVSATVQFSRNKLIWYDRLGNAHASTTLADGSNNLDISGLGWSGPLFYYKLNFFNNDYTKTPSVTFAEIVYTAGSGRIYYKQGAMVSKNLVATLIATTSLVTLDYFGYNLTLPASTTAYIQFGTTTDYWYGANGQLWATTTLEAGEHFSETTAISLSNLNWPTNTFYYKVTFETLNPTATPELSEIQLAYETVRPIYRSVGPGNTTALASSTGATLTISGSTATFSTAMPANMGVGDVIVYNAAGTGDKNSLAFIHGRSSDTVYTVKDVNGRLASSTSASTNWQVFRAYTSLANAEAGTENTGIPANLRDFDTWSGGKNLASTTEQWNIACYGDATDTTAVTIDGWTTTADNYIRIYTPYLTSEVGTSQRHSGKWDTGKYRLEVLSSETGIYITGYITSKDYYRRDVRIEGLQIWGGGGISVDFIGTSSDIRLSYNIIKGKDYETNGGAGIYLGITNANAVARIWNNIIYDFNGSGSSWGGGIKQHGWDWATSYAYNNTIINTYYGFYPNPDSWNLIMKNNIVQDCTDGLVDSYGVGEGPGDSDYNLSDLAGDVYGAHSKNSTTVLFADAANDDFHLRVGDSAARGYGANLRNDANLAFLDDIDGESRPENGAWDIGADQVARTTQVNTPLKGRGPTNGLVGYWTFDGQDTIWSSENTGTTNDVSGNGNNGTLQNMSRSSSPAPGISGQALRFMTDSEYIDAGSNSSLDNLGPITFTAWLKHGMQSGDNDAILFAKDLWTSGYIRFLMAYDGHFEFEKNYSTTNLRVDTDPCGNFANQWTFITLTWDGTNVGSNVHVYINGTNECTHQTNQNGVGTKLSDANNNLHIAGEEGSERVIYGLIDEVRIYNRALSADEIQELYKLGAARLKVNAAPSAPQGLNSGLVGYWTFDGPDTNWTSENSGTTADKSGNGNTGTMTNMSRTSSPAPGISGQALRFDMTDDYISIGTPASLANLPAISISAWIKPNSGGGEDRGVIIEKSQSGSWGWGFGMLSDALEFAVNFDGASDLRARTAYGAITFGKWTHVVMTWNGGSSHNDVEFYLNGTVFTPGGSENDGAGNRYDDSTITVNIGRNLYISTRVFDGLIDEVRIYNRVLSESEIQELYRLGLRSAEIRQ